MVLFLSFMNLFRNYRRTLAILLTIALGTGVLFSFKGFIHGVLDQYRESTIHAHYGHGQINTKNYRETVYAEPWKHWIENWEEIQSYLLKQQAVQHIFPRNNFSALLKRGNITMSGYGHGIEAEKEAEFFNSLNIEQGEALTNQEKGILLGKGLAKALDVVPGDVLKLFVNAIDGTITEAEFVVTGIFHTGSLDFDSKIFRIQLKQAHTLLKTSKIESISLGLRSHSDWTIFAEEFHKAFPNLDATSFDVLDKVYYQHSVDWLNAQFRVIQIIILSIVLLGIFNSISASILERKQEIGNFRANGESIADIMKLITLEGIFVGILGSCLGIGLAFIVMKAFLDHGILMPPGPGLTRPFYISFQFEWQMVYTTLGLTTAAAIIASALAGIRVAKMPIAKALRSY
jgi:putative ABC transport system permease protein